MISIQANRSKPRLHPQATFHPGTVAARISADAHRALSTELMLTPKPGLVDKRNCGAHDDMNLETFQASACTIASWWPLFFRIGYESAHLLAADFLPLVRPVGIECEKAMFETTNGVNTHKGAIFSLGLLCSAAGRLLARKTPLNRQCLCSEVAGICVGLVDRELSSASVARTAGERIFQSHGITGARGEAASGYAVVRSVALPIYDRARAAGIREDLALLQTLLHLLAVNNDTNLVSRGGLAGLDYVREYSATLIREGGAVAPDGLKKLEAFDDALIERRLSPGGSADLLAVTCFLAQFPAMNGGLEVR